MYLLDTDILIRLHHVRSGRADAALGAWFARTDSRDLHLSVMSLMELYRALPPADTPAAQVLRGWYDEAVRRLFARRLLPADAETAAICAVLPAADDVHTAWLAATARQYGLQIVSAYHADYYQSCGVAVLNPFQAA